jgi:hypothetical protein
MIPMNLQWIRWPLALLILLVGFWGTAPTQAWAAPKELSATAKKALDKTASQAGTEASERIYSLYTSFLTLQKEEQALDQRIKAIHADNTTRETELAKKIRELDAARLHQLALQVKQAKERHQPLFDQYTTLNKQIAAARLWKSKEMSYLLNLQAKAMKIFVEAARLDIRRKEEELRKAKTAANERIKTLRSALKEIEAPENRIKSLKQAIASANKQVSETWSALNKEVRAYDAGAVEASLSSLSFLSRQNVQSKESIYELEKQIAAVIRSVERKLP